LPSPLVARCDGSFVRFIVSLSKDALLIVKQP
jgi:hypothetical protein